jgi:hypothetical protein
MSVKSVCVLTGSVTGTLYFEQKASGGATTVTGTVRGLSSKATMHVHQYGDLTKGADSIGALYNPFGKKYNAGGKLTHTAPCTHADTRDVCVLSISSDIGAVDAVEGTDCQISISGPRAFPSLQPSLPLSTLLQAFFLARDVPLVNLFPFHLTAPLLSLIGANSVIGRAIAIKIGDDFLAYGVIGLAQSN